MVAVMPPWGDSLSRSAQVFFTTLKLYLPLCIAGESSGIPAINSNPFMETTNNPVSKSRVLLTWLFMVGMIVFLMVFFFWRAAAVHSPPPEEPGTAPGPLVHSIISLLIGGFFLVLGLMGYFTVILTGCFTFDYRRPVWNAVKAKKMSPTSLWRWPWAWDWALACRLSCRRC